MAAAAESMTQEQLVALVKQMEEKQKESELKVQASYTSLCPRSRPPFCLQRQNIEKMSREDRRHLKWEYKEHTAELTAEEKKALMDDVHLVHNCTH
jgi:hypothetical protein